MTQQAPHAAPRRCSETQLTQGPYTSASAHIASLNQTMRYALISSRRRHSPMVSVPRLNGSASASMLACPRTSVVWARPLLKKLRSKGNRATCGGLFSRSNGADTSRLHRTDIREVRVTAHTWRAVRSHQLVGRAFTYIRCTGSARHTLREHSGIHPKGKDAQAGCTCDLRVQSRTDLGYCMPSSRWPLSCIPRRPTCGQTRYIQHLTL